MNLAEKLIKWWENHTVEIFIVVLIFISIGWLLTPKYTGR